LRGVGEPLQLDVGRHPIDYQSSLPDGIDKLAERKHIPNALKLRLFSEAAGHCQRPDCLDHLFPAELGGEKHIAELAHVIPHGLDGPRKDQRPEGDFDPDTFDNLILLCPTCHTIVDKNPDAYPRNVLLGWKANHLAALALRQGIRAYDDRSQARDAILGAMDENRAIWDEYAPGSGVSFEYDPESEAAAIWDQRVKSVILPNHYRTQSIMLANQMLMDDGERKTFARYQEHVRGLSERHVCEVVGGAIKYPEEMDRMFA
jgi:hypothetical protein